MKSGHTREILSCPASQSTGFHFGKLPTVSGHCERFIISRLLQINYEIFPNVKLNISGGFD